MGTTYKEYDKIVEAHGFDKKICPNVSGHWGSQIPSDGLFDLWSQFLVKNVATQHFAKTYDDMREWGPKECKDFYQKRLLTKNSAKGHRVLKDIYEIDPSDNTIEMALGNANQDTREVLFFRWEQGLIFTKYSERIHIMMTRKAKAGGESAAKAIKKMQDLLKQRDRLIEDVDSLIPHLDDGRLKAMLKNLDISVTDVMDEDEA